jgi:Flp pilus assembly protein TadG
MRFHKQRFRKLRQKRGERGVSAMVTIVVLVPVIFALIGFGLDLGILYSIKGELKTAANAAALAAAAQLIGTDQAGITAAAAAAATYETTTGMGNRYYFHGLQIGQTTNTLESSVDGPVLYAAAADAIAATTPNGTEVSSALAQFARVTVLGQAKLLFWSFLPIVSDRNLPVVATAVAGISAPLCQACSIEPYAVAAINQADPVDFGFTPGVVYSFYFLCTGAAPPILPNASFVIPYVLLNRLNPNATVYPDEASQAFQDLAGGLPGNTSSAQACFRINNPETIWASAVVSACSTIAVAPVVTESLCGLDARFESTPQGTCSVIPNIDLLSTAYQPDTDTASYDTYTDYAGDARRIITIPITDVVSGTSSMNVLGFRQFLVQPYQGSTVLNPSDPTARFPAMYIGSVAPVKQGRFDGGCGISNGPGKVVLHQ